MSETAALRDVDELVGLPDAQRAAFRKHSLHAKATRRCLSGCARFH